MIVAVHAEWFDDLNAGAYTIALDGGVGEAFAIEDWVTNEKDAWVYATLQGLLAARERVPSIMGHEMLVIGDRADIAQLVKRQHTGLMAEAMRMRDKYFITPPQYRCRRFADRMRLRTVLRELVVSTKATEAA